MTGLSLLLKYSERDIVGMKIKLGLGKTDMASFTLYCGGELYDFTGNLGSEFEYVCTDSREADEDTMFIATRGERVDGHDYISDAIMRGCRCILCEYVPQDISGKRAAFSVVENSMAAFAQAAKGYRSENPLNCIAVTGSVGKTTTKELIASILRGKYKVYCTAGNFNSVIGMPMSMMEADGDSELAVFEMGMSGFGEMSSMSRAASPEIALIINIGTSHLEYLETRENIAKAKLEIADGLKDGGYLVLDGDEPLLKNLPRYILEKNINIVYASATGSRDADFKAFNIRFDDGGNIFDFDCMGKIIRDLRIPMIGRHFVSNALFACAAAYLAGAGEDEMRAGLLKYRPVGYRQNIYEKNGVTIIADCYNAAPESMRAAIDVLRVIPCKGKRIAVLGDMKELGRESENLHRSVGEYLAGKADMLFSLGKFAGFIADGAISGGMVSKSVYCAENNTGSDLEYIVSALRNTVSEGDAVLFKASRAMEFEKIIGALWE